MLLVNVLQMFSRYKKSPYLRAIFFDGADEGNRTLVSTLARWRSTIELHLHFVAKKAGFEPARQQCRPKALAGPPLEPLEYFFMPRRFLAFALI